jgi:outer membrane receptor for ferric coprogen and ferric-rhodotorulic acid
MRSAIRASSSSAQRYRRPFTSTTRSRTSSSRRWRPTARRIRRRTGRRRRFRHSWAASFSKGSTARPCPFGVGNGLPAAFSYVNFGKVRQKGLELGIDGAINKQWGAFANYTYQPEPTPTGFSKSELNIPPANVFNVGVNYGGPRFLGTLQINYTGKAFWQDVLDSRYAGYTDAYTLVNGSFGVKWGEKGKIVTMLKVTNLLNQEIQQHIFGDISKLQMVGEMRVGF